MGGATLAPTATATLVAPRVGGKAGISHLGTFDAAQAPRRRDVVLAPHAAGAAPGSRGSAGAPRSFSRRVSSRLVVARLNALSEPPAGSEVETKAERFLREELEHQAWTPTSSTRDRGGGRRNSRGRGIAPSSARPPVWISTPRPVTSLISRLRQTLGRGSRFRALMRPPSAPLRRRTLRRARPYCAAQEGDQARWLAFQRQAHR